MSTIVVCNNLCKSYPIPDSTPLEVLTNISWEMESGTLVAICGQSGCGKSTFMNILGLLDRQTSGCFTIANTTFDSRRDNSKLSYYRSRIIGFIFQQHHLLPELTAIENVMVPLLIRGESTFNSRKQSISILERLFNNSEIVSGVLERLPDKLSGGQCQRIAIARALVGNPPLVLADEPTGNLDENASVNVFNLFLKLQKELNISVIMVTHNLHQAKQADLIYSLRNKSITKIEGNSLNKISEFL